MLYRFSGHETFPCRYTWLPKAVVALQEVKDYRRSNGGPRRWQEHGSGDTFLDRSPNNTIRKRLLL